MMKSTCESVLSLKKKARQVGILDVTGCRWPVGENAKVIGTKLFCDAAQREGSAYCAHHAAEARADYSRDLIRRTIRSVVNSMKRGKAA